MFEADPNSTPEQLLDAIRLEAVKAYTSKNISNVVPPFAALLVRLSRDAAETAEKANQQNRRLVWLTWALLVVTAALVVRDFL